MCIEDICMQGRSFLALGADVFPESPGMLQGVAMFKGALEFWQLRYLRLTGIVADRHRLRTP